MKCLLADSSPESLNTLKSMRIKGLQLLACKTVDTLLHMYEIHSPKLILLDLELPYPGGLNAISRLRNASLIQKLNPIIIACSKRGDGAIVQQSQQQGADDFILKPLNREMVLGRLAKHFPDKSFESV